MSDEQSVTKKVTRSRGEVHFGRHIRSLREARGMTQEELAELSALSSDTIRRMEQGSFSPSIATISKLCSGLSLNRSTLFVTYELGERDLSRELTDAISLLSDRERWIALKLLAAIRGGLDEIGSDRVE